MVKRNGVDRDPEAARRPIGKIRRQPCDYSQIEQVRVLPEQMDQTWPEMVKATKERNPERLEAPHGSCRFESCRLIFLAG